jgi:KipI family sensor histidine kinase inhibitor
MRQAGDHAALLELPDNASVHAAARRAREHLGDQLVEVVPGEMTLLLVWPEGGVIPDISELALEGSSSGISDDGAGDPENVVIPVRYDGADLDAVAATLGMSAEAVVKLHSEAEYVVAFMGFSPGFPYLIAASHAGDVAQLLDMPRLGAPRAAVAAGSVAVAAGYCGIYPRSSPGGWNLLGRSDAVLFDVDRDPPALLEPGMRVRFDPVRPS